MNSSLLEQYCQGDGLPPFIINKKDGTILVQIQAGEFMMGDGKDNPNDNPKHKVYLDMYYIGVYAVTNRQYKVFVDETGHRPPDKSAYSNNTSIWKGKTYPSVYADHPVVCVSWDDARAYSQWAGLSLPTKAQWEKAARGPQGYLYPWGDKWDESKCRNYTNKVGRTTCPVYEYSTGISGYGTYNQSGNVWEWCSDWYMNPSDRLIGSRHMVSRGGCWYCGADSCRTDSRGSREQWHSDNTYGFRCVLAPGQQPDS